MVGSEGLGRWMASDKGPSRCQCQLAAPSATIGNLLITGHGILWHPRMLERKMRWLNRAGLSFVRMHRFTVQDSKPGSGQVLLPCQRALKEPMSA
jgi:hypothetical protein